MGRKAEGIEFRLASPSKPVVLIPVRVNGKGPFSFVLDTGAVVTTVSSGIARDLGIKEESSRELSFIPEGEQVKTVVALGKVDLEIGNERIPDVQVALADLSTLSKMAERSLDGIIGYTALKNYRVTVDYPNSRITLDRPNT